MNNLKFRAWHKELKEMGNITRLDFDFNSVWIYKNSHTVSLENRTQWIMKDIELMQFTGFKDKNSTDIYEGDIIILGNCDTFFIEHFKCIYTLRWDQKTSLGTIIHRDKFLSDYCEQDFKVIGNIYENSELLEC